jgi:hypothetical protein
MRLSLLLILLSIPCCIAANAQTMAGGEIYMGSFSMRSLKKENTPSSGYYIPVKLVQNFPARVGLKISVIKQINKLFNTGFFVGFISTGSRLTYSDYTGRMDRDIVVKGIQIASFNQIPLYAVKQYSLTVNFSIGTVFNTVSSINETVLTGYDYYNKEKVAWRSSNWTAGIGGGVERSFNKLLIRADAGYEINVPGMMKLKNGNASQNTDANWEVEWDGIRVGLSCSYQISKDK